MNKLSKVIYVNDDGVQFDNPEDAARPGETVTLAVYKLSGKVEVLTQMKQEIVVKKSGAKKPATKPQKPDIEDIDRSHSILFDQMKVTS